ncbi:MAG: EamA family transporter [Clostridia bacterium]|nr:EamA family transporter [Clostridia bacterium]
MWFIFALISTFGWGLADLFYKKSAPGDDRYSHLKTAIWVGIIMGVVSIGLLPFAESGFSLSSLVTNAIRYSPASISYIISMVVGYAGLRYLELSIISPVQNASGAFSTVAMIIYFTAVGRMQRISDEFSALDIIGTVIIVAGVVALAAVEKKLSSEEKAEDRKYKLGALALIFPVLYCVFDTAGTAADGIILDEETGLGLGEIDVIILYGLTFLLAAVICWIFLLIKTKKAYNPFTKSQKTNFFAACCEEFGQIFYVYAMARKPMLAAPIVACYCIVSVILSRIFLKEKLKASQYACVVSVIAGIVILGISEGLAEA